MTPGTQFRIKSGLSKLMDDVSAYFALNGVTASVLYGRRALTEQTNQGPGGANRVVFFPPDDGKVGEFIRDAKPGDFRQVTDNSDPPVVVARVRALYNWHRLVIVSIWAYDATAPNDERKQAEALETLHEWTVRAINQSAAGAANASWGKPTQNVSPTELKLGAEMRIELTIKTPVYDLPMEVAFPSPVLTTDPPK